jgi:oxygen-independent coproporphyrinogen-3 oxidase
MNDSLLRKMGRIHDAARNRAAFKELRIAGFDNISVDIIAGYPEQTCEDLGRSLLEVLEWRPEHISLYLLEVKPDTPLCERIAQGRVAAPDDDLQAEMYEMVCEQIGSNGYIQYEISNFSLPGYESRHNLKYWTDRVFMGLGSAAHGMTGQVRYINHERLTEYEAALRSRCLPEQRIAFSPEIRFREALIMGLRLTGGLDLRALGLRYEIDAETFVRTTVGQFEDAGLLCFDHGRVMLTPRGRLLSNLVFSAWV